MESLLYIYLTYLIIIFFFCIFLLNKVGYRRVVVYGSSFLLALLWPFLVIIGVGVFICLIFKKDL